MDLTPSERAVLGQVRVLYDKAPGRDHPLKTLTAQWPPLHYEAYKSGYAGLLSKRLIQHDGERYSFKITDAGLKVIGVAVSKPSPRIDGIKPNAVGTKRGTPVAVKAPATSRVLIHVLAALGLVALALVAGWAFLGAR
jgi:hypothetical protein